MIDTVKAELARRIGSIDGCGRPTGLAAEVDAIRATARRHGLYPAMVVAQAIEAALARGERGPLIHAWLGLLGEAVAGERQDVAAGRAFAAACAVRQAR